jgi:uracil-DNA glycosylase family 4
MQDTVPELAKDLLTHVVALREMGVLALEKAPDEAVRAGTGISPAAPTTSGRETLAEVLQDLGACDRCRLARGRQNIVFGSGNPDARVLFVGEGPGKDEDESGEPFVGRAGQLLTDIIEKGMRLPRAEVYICNVVKCRPPGNRNPEEDEVATCAPFLERQVASVAPEVVIALGKFAAHTLLNSTVPISRLRGQWHEYRGIPVMPTFHPAHLLRNPALKREVWTDIQQVMRHLGLPVGT